MRQIAALRGGLLWAAGRALSGAYRPLSGEQRGAKLSPKHHSTSGEAKSPELAGRTPPPPRPRTGALAQKTDVEVWDRDSCPPGLSPYPGGEVGGAEMDSCWVQRDKEWTELHQQSPESSESSGLACCTAQDFASSQGYRFSSDA